DGALQHQVAEQLRVLVVDAAAANRSLLGDDLARRFIDGKKTKPRQLPQDRRFAAPGCAGDDEPPAHAERPSPSCQPGASHQTERFIGTIGPPRRLKNSSVLSRCQAYQPAPRPK